MTVRLAEEKAAQQVGLGVGLGWAERHPWPEAGATALGWAGLSLSLLLSLSRAGLGWAGLGHQRPEAC